MPLDHPGMEGSRVAVACVPHSRCYKPMPLDPPSSRWRPSGMSGPFGTALRGRNQIALIAAIAFGGL